MTADIRTELGRQVGADLLTAFEDEVRRDILRERRRTAFFKRVVIGLTLAAFLSSLAVLEYGARRRTRLAGRIANWQEERGIFKVAPYLMHGRFLYSPEELGLSPFGYVPWPEESDRPDVIVLGGSTAAGIGASAYESTFFRRIARTTGTDVVSAAWPGYLSPQEALTLQFQLLPRLKGNRHAHIVLVSGYNDVYGSLVNGAPPAYPLNWWFIANASDVWKFLGARSALAHAFLENRIARTAPDVFFNLDKVVAALEINLHAMTTACRAEGRGLSYVLQPNGDVARLRRGMPAVTDYRNHDVLAVWTDFATAVSRICEREKITFVDGTLAIAPEEFLPGDSAHFTDEGQAVFSAFLQERLPEVFTRARARSRG